MPRPPAPAAAEQTPARFRALTKEKCNNPNALGVERVVAIDTTGGPGFGFQNFKAYDFLKDHEVVLTFDDGPWPGNTERVLKALADQCTKAMFFPIGEHAGWHPEILKKDLAAGMTVGSHTWSHKDLTKMPFEAAKAEVEKGIAAISVASGNKPIAPFFRFPALRMPPEIIKYLASRNIAIMSTDWDSFDFKMRRPQTGRSFGDQPAGEARQGHHPDARLPARDLRGDPGDPEAAQGEGLQDRAGGGQEAARAAAGIRQDRRKGDGRRAVQRASDVERGQTIKSELT